MPEPIRLLLHDRQTGDKARRLAQAHPDAVIAECNSNTDLPAVIARFRPEVIYSIRFTTTAPYPAAAIFAEGGPAWLAVGGVGVDHLGQWDPARTTVTNAAGVAAGMMAEYILGTFLHFSLDIPGLQADKAAHRWDRSRLVTPLQGKTLLIAGLGHTGEALAHRAKAFGMRVIGTRARPAPMDSVDVVGGPGDLLGMAREADFVAVTSPLLPATRGMIGAAFFDALKSGAILSDVSRGGVADHDALMRALASGKLAGAALDVFETEPLPQDAPIWDAPNLLISPHCSSVHSDWAAQSFALFLDNLNRWRGGAPLFNVVDPARGY
jgi:phosphoglycerate dehydrogenase-like enzyme